MDSAYRICESFITVECFDSSKINGGIGALSSLAVKPCRHPIHSGNPRDTGVSMLCDLTRSTPSDIDISPSR